MFLTAARIGVAEDKVQVVGAMNSLVLSFCPSWLRGLDFYQQVIFVLVPQ